MGFLSIGKIIKGGIQVLEGTLEGESETVMKGAKNIGKGILGIIVGKSGSSESEIDVDD